MTPQMRHDLDLLPRYVSGSPASATGYKLSSNELAESPDEAVSAAVAQRAPRMNRYPDVLGAPLAKRLAEFLSVDASRIVPGAGSIAVLQQLIQAAVDPGGTVVFAWRSYEAYPILARVCHAKSVTVPLLDHRHDLAAMAEAVIRENASMVIVCNPNNPTGTTVDARELERFLDAVPTSCIVVLDEAYREFVTDQEVADGIAIAESRDNVVVLRTFSKAHGLAGVRVGYAICPEGIADAMRAVSLPFTVSVLAEAAGIAALDSWPWQSQVVAGVCERRDQFVDALRQAGATIPTSQANFVWLPWTDDSQDLADRLAVKDISIRPFAGEGLRITIGETEALATVVEVIAGALSGSPTM